MPGYATGPGGMRSRGRQHQRQTRSRSPIPRHHQRQTRSRSPIPRQRQIQTRSRSPIPRQRSRPLSEAPRQSDVYLLSHECQSRRFNPVFIPSNDRGHMCSVNIMGTVVSENRSYDTAEEAKQSIARKALDVVRQLPLPDRANRAEVLVAARREKLQREERQRQERQREERQRQERQREERQRQERQRQERQRQERQRQERQRQEVQRIRLRVRPRANSPRRALSPPSLPLPPDQHRPGVSAPIFMRLMSSRPGAPAPANSYRPVRVYMDDPVARQAYLQGRDLGFRAGESAHRRDVVPVQQPQVRPDEAPRAPSHTTRIIDPRERSPPPYSVRVYRERR
ncbi:hypothetical protein GGR52DRAFT_262392 [Hypoxylon sp. FL1284]|nr:hypothetical protein GGR52DRAFT_262392 [Hypoxylon sp. FL1284]